MGIRKREVIGFYLKQLNIHLCCLLTWLKPEVNMESNKPRGGVQRADLTQETEKPAIGNQSREARGRRKTANFSF